MNKPNLKPQHTPTPWTLQRNDDLTIVGEPEGDGDYRFIASVDSTIDTGGHTDDQLERDQANAAFIVKAVNCHEELVSLLKSMLPFVSIAGHQINGKPAFDVVKETLAKAEGR